MSFAGEFPATQSGIGACMDFIEESLKSYRVKKYDLLEGLLISEEILIQLADCAPEDAQFRVKVSRYLGIPRIRILVPGEALQLDGQLDMETISEMGDESETVIRDLLLRSYENSIKCHHNQNGNVVTITTGIPERALSSSTVVALLLSVVVGVLLRGFVPESVCLWLADNLLQPMETALVSALTLIAAPAIFASVVCSTLRFDGFADLGKSSKGVLFCYLCSSIAVTLIAWTVFRAFTPGEMGLLSQYIVGEGVGNFSVANVLASMIPSNIMEPFLNVDSLQLMVLAMIIGMALLMGGRRVGNLRTLIEEMDTLCGKISSLIMAVIPFGVFFATTEVILHASMSTFYAIGELTVTLLFALFCVFVFYILCLIFLVKVSPSVFFKKYGSDMRSTLLKGSGVAAIPITIRACQRLGVSKKLTYYAVPLGAAMNMDGNCVGLTIISLFFSHVCGVELHGGDTFILIFSVLILSLGAPIAPGTIVLCMLTLLKQMGISPDAISLIIGLNFMLEMLLGMMNSLGDVVVALVVSRFSNTLDTEQYYKDSNTVSAKM